MQVQGVNQLAKEIQECSGIPNKYFDELFLHKNEETFEVEGAEDHVIFRSMDSKKQTMPNNVLGDVSAAMKGNVSINFTSSPSVLVKTSPSPNKS